MARLIPSGPLCRAPLCAAAASLLWLAACFLRPSETATESFTSMGTLASVTVAATYRERLPQLTADVKAEFRRIENQLSTYQDDSEVSQLARQAGTAPVPVSADTRRVLELSKLYGEMTGGAFDVTVAPLVRLWGFGVRQPVSPPEPEAIRDQLRHVNFRLIDLESSGAFLPAGTSVDLGGIAKGYAVDRAFELARRAGVQAAMLDLGGNIRVLGRPEKGTAWTIGIRDPFDREALVGRISLADGMAVATSGNYERFVDMGGRRFCHIIDPRTGYPVEGMASVTVVAPEGVVSDALSTGLFVLGLSRTAETLRRCPGVEALVVPDRSPAELWLTPGMARVFEPQPEFSSRVHLLQNPEAGNQ